MTSPIAVEAASAAPRAVAGNGFLHNGFHIACLAFLRARQLKNGGRPRLEAAGHKYLWVAMREVEAGMVAWDATGSAAPADAASL